jgi:L-ascorbate 6-phosphate lactonase
MRDVAFWPRAFLDELEQAKIETGPVLWALGGPSFLYRSPETTIWIDPYFGGTPDDSVADAYRAVAIPVDPSEVRKADVVISTHDHVDHCHQGTITPIIANTDAVCVGPRSSAKLMRGWGIPEERLTEVAAGATLHFGDVSISVHGADDPGEPDAVTYLLESEGVTLFVSGDTARCPELAEIGASRRPDYALLAFGRTWYMSEEQMLQAARDLSPATLLPFHWEFWRNHTGDIVHLLEIYFRETPPFDLKILAIGDSLALAQRQSDAS